MEKRLEVCKTAIPSELGCGVGEPVRPSYRKHGASSHGVFCSSSSEFTQTTRLNTERRKMADEGRHFLERSVEPSLLLPRTKH
jgi:hypothetical protein